MKLCFLSDARAEHTRRWVKYFALKGHSVDLITWNPSMLNGYEPVRVHLLAKPYEGSGAATRALNLLPMRRELRALLRSIRPDVLHAHSSEAYAWMAMLSGFRPYVVTPWGTDILIETKRSRMIRVLNRRALRRADLVTCDAVHMKRELVELDVAEDRIEIVMFGTDIRRFRPDPERRSRMRRDYSLGDAPVVISTRTLTPVHDIATFVRAIPLVRQKQPTAQFIVAADGSERTALEQLVLSLEISDCTTFVGRLEEDEMAAWLNAADVYASTSLMDAGLAGSTAEAMASELPAVVSDNSDNRDWVIENEGGLLFSNGDWKTLAGQLVQLLAEPDTRRRFGQLNRRMIAERNNYVTQMDLVERLYAELPASTEVN